MACKVKPFFLKEGIVAGAASTARCAPVTIEAIIMKGDTECNSV